MTKPGPLLRGAILIVLVLLIPSLAFAGGIEFGAQFYTLDLTETLKEKAPEAIGDAFASIPEINSQDIVDAYEDIIAELEGSPAGLLFANFPVPLIGGAIEFPLQIIMIDGLRISGGFLNDQLGRSMLGLFGVEYPVPLFEESFAADGFTADVTINPAFSTFMLSTELVKRLDLLIAGIDLGLGVDLIQGWIDPGIDITATYEEETIEIDSSLLHVDGFTWSAFAAHGLLGIEIGPPFLRLFIQARFRLPLSQTPGWWEIKVGRLAGSVGIAIRF